MLAVAGAVGAYASNSDSAAPTRVQTPIVAHATLQPGVDVLAGVGVQPRVHRFDYRRAAFGDAWTDDNDAPLGHNGCDTRDDILNRDLVNKTLTVTKRCPDAVETGVLHDPYTNKTISFTRGAHTGQAVQIDHIVPLAYAWDMGAYDWPQSTRVKLANDPQNLLAVDGPTNQEKHDKQPALWMPPNKAFGCDYAVKFADVLRAYQLPIDPPSVAVIRQAAKTR